MCVLIASSTHVDMITYIYVYIQYYIIFYFYGNVSFAWDSLFIWNAEIGQLYTYITLYVDCCLKNTTPDSSCLRPK